MTQFPQSSVPIPNARIAQPGIGVPRIGSPGTSSAAVNEAIGAGIAHIGDTLMRIQDREDRARRARQLTQYETKVVTQSAQANEEVSTGDLDTAKDTFNARMDALREEAEGFEDPVVKDGALLLLQRHGNTAAIKARREIRRREGVAGLAEVNALDTAFISEIGAGNLRADEAIDRYNEASASFLDTTFDESTLDDAQVSFAVRAVRESADALATTSPELVEGYLETELAQKWIGAAERAKRIKAAKVRIEENNAIEAEEQLQGAREDIRRFVNQPADGLTGGALRELVGGLVDELRALPGAKVRGAFVPDRVATADELRAALLGPELTLAASTGEVDRFDAIADVMKRGASADVLEAIADARVTLESVDAQLRKADTGAARLGSLYRSKQLPDDPSQVPQDQQSRNKFYQDAKLANQPPADVAEFFAELGGELPSDLISDIARNFSTQTLDVNTGLARLRAIHRQNPRRAATLARGLSENSDYALTALEVTKDLDLESDDAATIMEQLNDPRAPEQIKNASVQLFGNGRVGKTGVAALDVSTIVGGPQLKGAPLTVEVLDVMNGQFMFGYLQSALGGNIGDVDKMVAGGTALAKGQVANQFAVMDVLGESYFMPATAGVGSASHPNFNQFRLQNAINDYQDEFDPGLIGQHRAKVRPDLSFNVGTSRFFPAMSDAGVVGFMEWKIVDGERGENITAHRERERRGGSVRVPDPLFKKLEREMLGRNGFEDAEFESHLRYKPEFGVSSVEEFDRRFYGTNPQAGMVFKLVERVEQEFVERTGLLPYYRPGQDLEEIQEQLEIKRERLGWPRWSAREGELDGAPSIESLEDVIKERERLESLPLGEGPPARSRIEPGDLDALRRLAVQIGQGGG